MTQGAVHISHGRNKSISAGRVAGKGRTGCLFIFFFIHPRQGGVVILFCTLNPHLTGAWGISKKWNLSWMYSAGCWIYFQDKTLTYCCVAHTHWGAKRQVMLNQSQQLGNTSAGLRKEKKTTYFSFHMNKEHIFQTAIQLTLTYSYFFFSSRKCIFPAFTSPTLSDLDYTDWCLEFDTFVT